MIIIIIIIVLLYCIILQNNLKITILTFMNVDGAFILAETHRKTSVLLLYLQQIYKWFWGAWEDVCRTYRIGTCLKKIIQMLLSNWRVTVFVQIFLTLWTLNPGAASLCSAVWITLHAIRACIRKQNILQFIY